MYTKIDPRQNPPATNSLSVGRGFESLSRHQFIPRSDQRRSMAAAVDPRPLAGCLRANRAPTTDSAELLIHRADSCLEGPCLPNVIQI